MSIARTSGVIAYTNKLIDYQFERREQEADEKTTAGTAETTIQEQRVGKLHPFEGHGQNSDAAILRSARAVGE
jgi:hypothetical protein